jgi:hypothetical protein
MKASLQCKTVVTLRELRGNIVAQPASCPVPVVRETEYDFPA